MSARDRWALGVSAFFVLACLAILWETRDIPPGTFEPLGSAPVPQATALLILALSLAVAIGALRGRRSGGGDEVAPEREADAKPRPLDAAVTAGLTIAYVAMLDARALDFAPVTALYLFAVIGFLVRFERRGLVVGAVIAVTMGWGAAAVFTRLFVVDLPGL